MLLSCYFFVYKQGQVILELLEYVSVKVEKLSFFFPIWNDTCMTAKSGHLCSVNKKKSYQVDRCIAPL